MSAGFSVFGTLAGCVGCMVCVEALAKEQPSAMNLLTFSNFLFISIEGLLVTTRLLSVPNKIPLRGYLPVVLVFFACNVINNLVLKFHVPVPLHIVFRSGSLLTSLLMNRILSARRYSQAKYASVIAITVGIIICTMATAASQKKAEASSAVPSSEVEQHYHEWLLGVGMLITALLLSSYLAILQERLYTRWGKHPREAMFYVHALSLPFFALIGTDIWRSALSFTTDYEPVVGMEMAGQFYGLSQPWLMLIGACLTQWLCILFVYRIGAQMDSLSVTMVVTLRKFLSLLISVFWFQNAFTPTHWVGALLVFGGTLIFSYSR